MPKIISLYIAKHFLYRFFILAMGILLLIYVITFAEMMRKIDADTQTTFVQILYLALSQIPPIIDKIFPFLILLSSLWSIFGLLKTSELIIFKTAAVSVWKISKIYCVTSFFISMIYVFALMPVLALMHQDYRQWEHSHIETVDNIYKKIIIPDTKQIAFLTASQMSIRDNTLRNVYVAFMDNQALIKKIYFSKQAFYNEATKQIKLDNFDILNSVTDTIPLQTGVNFELPVNLNNLYNLDNTKQSVTSIYSYKTLIKMQKEQKLSTQNILILFYGLLILPITCSIYSFIGVAFVPNLSRGAGKGIGVIVRALCLGVLFYILDNWIMAVASNGKLPLFIAIITFKISVFLVCIIRIFNKEYGFETQKNNSSIL